MGLGVMFGFVAYYVLGESWIHNKVPSTWWSSTISATPCNMTIAPGDRDDRLPAVFGRQAIGRHVREVFRDAPRIAGIVIAHVNPSC